MAVYLIPVLLTICYYIYLDGLYINKYCSYG
mgnify:CR=1 FL=1|jgi:hypothetical protein